MKMMKNKGKRTNKTNKKQRWKAKNKKELLKIIEPKIK